MSTRLSALAILVLAVAVYIPGLNGPFLLDDYTNFQNIQINDLSLDSLKDAASGEGRAIPYRPLARLTLILNNYFSGTGNAYYHKLTNLLIHLLTGFVLYNFCLLCFKTVTREQAPSQYKNKKLLALIITGIWLLHPLQVSTVLYLVQRMAQLASLFTLLALIVYLRARLAERGDKELKLIVPIAGISFFTALAFLCKENAALIPLYILTIEGLLFRFKVNNDQNRSRLRLLLFILVLLPVILVLIYFTGHHEKLLNYNSRNFTLGDRLLTQPVVIVYYLGLILFPSLSRMGLYLDDFTVYQSMDVTVFFSISLLVGLAALVIVTRKKHPLIAFGITWFLVSHLLESTFLPLEIIFEHRNYLALFGPVLSLILILKLAAERFQIPQKITATFIIAIILLLSGQTFLRSLSWGSQEDFAATHLINHPDSWRTHYLLAQIAALKGNRELLLAELEQVSRINPADTSHHVLRVLAWCPDTLSPQQIDNAVHATATISFSKAARSVLYAIRDIEYKQTNKLCPAVSPEDLLRLTTALMSNPVIRNKPLKNHLHARALATNKQLDEAKIYYLKAWRLKPQNTQPALEIVQLLQDEDRITEACDIIDELEHAHIINKENNKRYASNLTRLKALCPAVP